MTVTPKKKPPGGGLGKGDRVGLYYFEMTPIVPAMLKKRIIIKLFGVVLAVAAALVQDSFFIPLGLGSAASALLFYF
jgi:hypothetical protein